MNIKMNLIENSRDYLINSIELYAVADEFGTHSEDKSDKKKKAKWKLAFVSIVQSMELLLKYCLYLENPVFIYEDIDAERLDQSKTISVSHIIPRITNIGKNPFNGEETDLLKKCFRMRNSFIHCDVTTTSEEIKKCFAGIYRLYKNAYTELCKEKWIDFEELSSTVESLEFFAYNDLKIFHGVELTYAEYAEVIDDMKKYSGVDCFVTSSGTPVKRVAFGEENSFLLHKGYEQRMSPVYDLKYCDDCLTKHGSYHLPFCDLEICPLCGKQKLSCACDIDLIDE